VPSNEAASAFPLSQRIKNYSSASGHVYEYIFAGKVGQAHVFDVLRNRKHRLRVEIVLGSTELAECERRLGSALRWNDEYALAKLALFHAFDEREDIASFETAIQPPSAELIGYMKTLRMVEEVEEHE
jgi:hypothetical protein